MKRSEYWFRISAFFAWFGMCLGGPVLQAHAQWSGEKPVTLHRGLIAHSIFNLGMSGKRDNDRKQGPSSFSYPMGRSLKVYSGGSERGWNEKSHSAGEGLWVLSNTRGKPYVSAAGGAAVTPDVVGMNHDPGTWPEAYLGVVHDPEYALAIRDQRGSEAVGTRNINLVGIQTNWWPSEGGISSAQTPISGMPVGIWNFRYGRYNSGKRFEDRVADGVLRPQEAPDWAVSLSEDDFPELVVVSGGRSTETGLQWTRKWFQWGHADYDDFLINETVVKNASSVVQEGVYIVIRNRFWSQQSGGWREASPWNVPHDWARDDHARSTLAANYLVGVSRDVFLAGGGKPAGLQLAAELAEKGHAMLYFHDGESGHLTNQILDVGDPYRYELARNRFTYEQPWVKEGFLNHSSYFGIGVVDAMPPFNTYGGADLESYVFPKDNPNTPHDESLKQPASVTIWRYTSLTNFMHPSPWRDSPAFIYDTLTQAGYHDEPDDAYSYSHFMAFGPYDLGPGEKCKVVVAYVGGQGANDPKYSDYKRYPQPFNFGWMNLFGGTSQADVPFADRQREIPLGEDAMLRHFLRALDAYAWGYDIPNQPPSIKLSFQNTLEGQTELSWSAFGEESPDPDYEAGEAEDIRGYRIYRSEVENQGPWAFAAEFSIADARAGQLPHYVVYEPEEVFRTSGNAKLGLDLPRIPLRENPYRNGLDPAAGPEIEGIYRFVDGHSKAGFPAWYSVRYYDSGHTDWKGTGRAVPPLESAPGPSGGAVLGGPSGGQYGIIPVLPGAAIFDRLERQIRVVPNPYKADDDLHSYQRSEYLRFINLPARCHIDIYDVTGQWVWTETVDDPSKGEISWSQKTFGGARSMLSGIYFWRVTSLMPESEGKVQQGTFAVIK